MKVENLRKSISEIKEPRRSFGNLRHMFDTIVVVGLLTFLCGGKDYVDMEELGKAKYEWLRGFLEFPNGVPDSDTFRRLFERIDCEQLSACLDKWFEYERGKAKFVAIDGKTIRGSANADHRALHVVSAWASDFGITLGQVAVDEKSNEITAIPELIEALDIRGAVVTIDAMGCQTAIAEAIRQKDADYLLALKANHKTFYKAAVSAFDAIKAGDKSFVLDVYSEDSMGVPI
jgi:predicted transposase YbfD/YdcC